ncbi:MAG TPA: FAD-linked oxidase C-terminal domain-containing protein [Terriglobia bacterium]|nr:FAD-linked oxidase C-terminal domain-containing protein [Terriglobia bacterium]
MYSTDASIYEIEPIGVVIPRTHDDVLAAMETAHEFHVPVLPRGGGTSLAGQTVGAALVIDMSKYLNRVVEVNTEERWAIVEPGVVQEQLNLHLRPMGFLFGPDTSTANRATLGGMMGNNSAGSHSILYGKTIDHVLEMDAILASGEQRTFKEITFDDARRRGGLEGRILEIVETHRDEIDRRFPKIMRRVSGYNLDEFVRKSGFNLARMLVGSEGTLAMVQRARVRIEPRPPATALCVVHFKDIVESIQASDIILPFNPSAVELIDDMILDLARGSLDLSRQMGFIEGHPAALLLVEFYGENEAELRSKVEAMEAALKREKSGYAYVREFNPVRQQTIWKLRKAGLGLLLGMKGERKPIAFVEDCAVEPAKLPEFFVRFREVIHKYGTTAGYYGHASVGCLHIRPCINTKDPRDIQVMKEMTDDITDLVLEFGGGMSGEHGDGLARSHLNEKLFGTELYNAFRQVKRAFDPECRMNPGKIVDAPPMTENLRYGERYGTIDIKTHYDFSREGGLATAVELCNGAGVCRKKNEGTMCPSYMVTMEDMHSTRGRANLMREILSGKLPAHELTGHALHDALDLCLECKGCKAECPSNVDMAKLKYEVLAHSNERNGASLRSRIFANIHTLSRLASLWPSLANALGGSSPARAALDRYAGIDRRRRLPPFAAQRFESWFRRRKDRPRPNGGKKVVFFHDTFVDFNYPEIGKAATRLLEAAGYEVALAERRCCGRPMISKGFPEAARENAAFNVRSLLPFVEKGYAIVGCEPSCILTFRDEYPDLLKGSAVEKVAAASYLLEEFIVKEKRAGRWTLEFQPQPARALIHGHCHEKALIGSGYLKEALGLAYRVEEVDSGCCGMAGSFGFEKEHYDVSMAIGRRRLFGAVEGNPEAVVVAPGVSCRQQIEHATGRVALHPAEALARALS